MNLSCNCDMPIEIYADWLQDQGWDTDEMRSPSDPSESGIVFGLYVNKWGDGHEYGDGYYLEESIGPHAQSGAGYAEGKYGDAVSEWGGEGGLDYPFNE